MNGLLATGDSLTFTSTTGVGGTTLNNNLTTASFSIAGITFASGAPAYTINGNAFGLTSAGIVNSSANSQTFGTPITLLTGNADTNVNPGATASNNTITLNGGITYGTSRLFTATNGGTIVLNGGGSGTGRTGVNVFSLTAANSTQLSGYAMRVNNAGTVVVLGNATALGSGAYQSNTATVTLQSNASLIGANAVGNALVLANNQFIGGTNAIEFSGTSTALGTGGAGSAGAIINTGGNRSLFVTNTAATTVSGRVALSDDIATGRTLTVDVAGTAGTTTISGAIVDYVGANGSGTGGVAGSLTKANAGTLVLSGTNTYTGATTVTGGRLLINGTQNQGTGSNAGKITANSGTTLGGTGTVNLSDTNGGGVGISVFGTFAPGDNGIGTFTVNDANSARSSLAFETGSTLQYDLGAGLTADRFALTGGKTNGQVFFNNNTINFNDLTGGSLQSGQYTLFSGSAGTNFSGLSANGSGVITSGLTIGSGLSGYTTSLQFVGTDIVLDVALVPEPTTVAALVGIGGLLVGRRRRV